MESEHKAFLLGIISIGIVAICITLVVHMGEAIKVNAGLQECKYAVVGSAGIVTAWLKECPKSQIGPIVVDSENVK